MESEKLFPIHANPNLCVKCQKCSYSCPPKATFFKNSARHVDYDKCEGCLKCVDVCEHGAIEVISIAEGTLKGFDIDQDKCNLCKRCLEQDFCFQTLFSLEKDKKTGKEFIVFKKDSMQNCFKCLKCFKTCPSNAILPTIINNGIN